jgi:hypothetical protein
MGFAHGDGVESYWRTSTLVEFAADVGRIGKKKNERPAPNTTMSLDTKEKEVDEWETALRPL